MRSSDLFAGLQADERTGRTRDQCGACRDQRDLPGRSRCSGGRQVQHRRQRTGSPFEAQTDRPIAWPREPPGLRRRLIHGEEIYHEARTSLRTQTSGTLEPVEDVEVTTLAALLAQHQTAARQSGAPLGRVAFYPCEKGDHTIAGVPGIEPTSSAADSP